MPTTQLDFQQAKAKHLLFKSRLRAILYDQVLDNEAAVLSQYACEVGRWIYGHALIDYETIPEVKTLEEVHATIHVVARDLIARYRAGHVLEARQGLAQIEQIADELVHLLDIVDEKVRAASTTGVGAISPEEQEQADALTALLERNQRLDARLKMKSTELAEKEQIFTTIMSASPVVLWMSDAHGAVTYVNQTWINWTGAPFSTHLGTGWTASVVADDRDRTIAQFLADVAAHRHYVGDFRIKRHDGAIRWCTAAGQPWYTDKGLFGGYAGSCVDVTEHRLAEQALYKETERERQLLHDFFTQSPAIHCILRGPNHVFELVNAGYYELVGEGDILGKPLREALPELAEQGFVALLDQVYTTHEAFIGREVMVAINKAKQGLVDVYVNFIYQPILDQHGQTEGILVFAYDVTDQVMARQRIEASEARFRLLIEEAPVATALYAGPDHHIELANELILRQWGKGPSVIGLPLAQALPELEGQPFLALLDEVYTTGVAYHASAAKADLVINGQRTTSYFNFTYKPLRDTDGQVYAILNMAIDVTPQVMAREQVEASELRFRQLSEELDEHVQQRTQKLNESNLDLQRSNRNLEQFAYIASHDLQEPLRKIQSFGGILRQAHGEALGTDGIDILSRMEAGAARMSVLIQDLLTFSRIATRQAPAVPVVLTQVLAEVLDNLALAVAETGGQVQLGTLPVVQGDASQLGQLFQNLLTNALKFHRPDVPPMIQVRATEIPAASLPAAIRPARAATAYHQIDVADNGIGFDTKYVDRIFQVFQRLHGRGQFAGTGVGLAICEKVAINHGGAITAHSYPGEGATFVVYLPVQ